MEKEQKKEFKELLKEILDIVLDKDKFDPKKLRELAEKYKNLTYSETEIEQCFTDMGLSSFDCLRIQTITRNCLSINKKSTRQWLFEKSDNLEDKLKETRKKL